MQVLIGCNDLHAGRQLLFCSSSTMDKAVRLVKMFALLTKLVTMSRRSTSLHVRRGSL